MGIVSRLLDQTPAGLGEDRVVGVNGEQTQDEEVLSSDMYVNARIPLDPLEPVWGIIEE